MKIYWIKAQAPRQVLALTKHLGLDAELVQLDPGKRGLKSLEYAALNPNLTAPTLVDGDRVIWEASAIMSYLCVRTGSNLWPTQEPLEQVEVLRWLSWNDCHWSKVVSPFYFEHVVKATFDLGPPDREKLEKAVAGLERFAKVLDAHLAGRDHAACGRLTIADFRLAAMATDWREAEMPLRQFPSIVRWLDGLSRLPAWSNPWPQASRDAA